MEEQTDFLTEAKTYTRKYLSKTSEYKRHKDNDYYHITQFSHYLATKTKPNKEIRKIVKAFIRKTTT